MVKRYVVELELDDAQLETWERAQALAGELRELFMLSATSLRAYPERRAAIDALHAQIEQLAPQLGWLLLDGRQIAEPAPSAQTRAEATTRELPAATIKKRPAPKEPPRAPEPPPEPPAPIPIERVPARPVDLDAERAAFERALAQHKTAPVEERAVVVGRVPGWVPELKAVGAPAEPEAVEELRKRFAQPEPEPAPAPAPEPVDPLAASRADQHRLAELVSSFGNPPQDLGANPGSEIGQIHSGLTRVSAKQWKALLGRSRLALAAYLVARLRAARQMASMLERGAGRHADRVRQALQQLRRVCGPDATRVPGLVNEAEPARGSWHDVALSMRAALDVYAAGGDAADLWAAFNTIGKAEAAPQTAQPDASADNEPPRSAPPAEPDAPRSPDDTIRRLHAQLHEGTLTDAQLGLALGQLLEAGVKPTETRLINLADRLDERFISGKEFKNLRAALRKRRKETVAEDDNHAGFSPPEDWPLWHHVRGKRMAILGGDRRPERADAIAAAFQLAEVDWIECREDSQRPVQSLVERMRNQTLDLVVVVQRYVSHSHSDAVFAAEQAGCRAVLAYSYGLQNILQGLERFLGNAE